MTSQKQRAANRRNALHSTGPKSDEGRRRSAVNALRHGLSMPIESTPWHSMVPNVSDLLQKDGFSAEDARNLASLIMDYERNVANQRDLLIADQSMMPKEASLPEAALRDLAVAAKIGELRKQKVTHLMGMDAPLAREMQEFLEKTAARQAKVAQRDEVTVLKNADRYLRRAANQLIRELKRAEG